MQDEDQPHTDSELHALLAPVPQRPQPTHSKHPTGHVETRTPPAKLLCAIPTTPHACTTPRPPSDTSGHSSSTHPPTHAHKPTSNGSTSTDTTPHAHSQSAPTPKTSPKLSIPT